MPATVYYLPNENDRATIDTALNVFLSTGSGVTRDIMLGVIYFTLKDKGIRRLHMSGYMVGIDKYERVYFHAAKRVNGNRCPVCGACIYSKRVRILTIDEKLGWDDVHYGCSCGMLFHKTEKLSDGRKES